MDAKGGGGLELRVCGGDGGGGGPYRSGGGFVVKP